MAGLRFDTGRPCLDLVATRTGRPPRELLGTGERLAAWLHGTGLLPGEPAPPAEEEWLPRFLELRDVLQRVVAAQIAAQIAAQGATRGAVHTPALTPAEAAGHAPTPAEAAGHAPTPAEADLAELNALALAAPPAHRVVAGDGGTLVRALAVPPDCAGLLAAVARDAVDLLTDPVARSQLRRCEGANCLLVYLDTSRGRRRRWCSSEICGNRERVARHRRRASLMSP